jgi:hypothetical protein
VEREKGREKGDEEVSECPEPAAERSRRFPNQAYCRNTTTSTTFSIPILLETT